jgi:GAF domain-containing protein
MKFGLFAARDRKPLFYWFVLATGATLLGLYVFAGWMIVRYGTIGKELGWETDSHGGEWYISIVFPNGPTTGILQVGDRILALNGDTRVGRIGPGFKLQEIPPEQTSYTIRVARGSNELEFALSMPLSRNFGNLWEALPSFPVSLAFFIVGLLVGVLKADERFARLGCLALLAAALSLLRETLLPVSEFFHGHERFILFLLGSVFPLQFVLAYHFYYRFPPGVSPGRFWRALKYFIYATGAFTFLWLNSVRLLSLRHGEPVALFFYDHPRLLYFYVSLHSSFELIAVIAIFAVIVRNYFKVKEPDQRRRSRLVLYGSVGAFFVILLANVTFNVGYMNPMGLASTTLDWVSNIACLLIPVSTGYAILKHRMFDINVVIRRTLQYLLAKHALQFILSLPLLGLIYTLLSNPNRTLAEVLFRNSVYFYALSFVAAAISLKFRQQLRLWIDRKFFREAYDREKNLRDLIDKVKDLDSIPEIAKVVSHEVDAALHPKSIYLFYREEGTQDLSLGYSSGEARPDLCIPGDFRLLRFMEDQGSAQVLPFPPKNRLPQSEKDWLTQLEANLIVPMSGTNDRIAGLLLLGEKKSEAAYTAADQTLLEAFAGQLAIVYENVQLKQHIHKEGKLKREVLARFEERNINLLKECPHCGACYDNHEQACAKDRNELILSLPVERTIDGKYRLDQLLGKGGMGAVYAATDLRIKRQVAIKVMLGNLFGDRTALGRFKREARACAKLSHPNIIAVYDFGDINAGSAQGAYMVMELVRGSTLRAAFKRDKVLHRETAAGYFKQTLDGVEAAHRAGVIHRDLKPENIFLTAQNGKQVCVKILDFGLAKIRQSGPSDSGSLPMTSPGTVMGTFAYMSPEQIEGKEIISSRLRFPVLRCPP